MSMILCIDDEPWVGAVLERHLSELGHEALVVMSVEAALLILASRPVDLVIADDPLPGATALDLLAALREQGLEVPVILMTTHSSRERAMIGLSRGAIEHLSKPLRTETLRLAVTHAIESTRLKREIQDARREIDALRTHVQRSPQAPNRDAAALAGPGDRAATAPAAGESELPLNLRALQRIAIERALAATGGHRTRAARLLGICERTLRNKLNVRIDPKC